MNNINAQSDLIKYCYFNESSNTLRETTIEMIINCENKDLIACIDDYFNKLIKPYFYAHRRCFNKIRALFMSQVLALLIDYKNGVNVNIDIFSHKYNDWCKQSNIFGYSSTKELFKKIAKTYNLRLPDEFLLKENSINVYL